MLQKSPVRILVHSFKMAAPMTLPSHHLKGEVAENRPAYREGRIPKATKVQILHFCHKPQEIKNNGSIPN